MLKSLIKFLFIGIIFLVCKNSLAAVCVIPDYLADYTISTDCTDFRLSQDYNQTLTVDANISAASLAFYVRYSLDNLIINSGNSISVSGSQPMYFNPLAGQTITLGSFINNGTITTNFSNALSFNLSGTLSNFTNNGLINTGAAGYGVGVSNGFQITNFTNTGDITSAQYGIQISYSNASIATLNNTGTINGSSVDIYTFNTGTIGTLINSQGKRTSDPLTYRGTFPTSYEVIINSASDYGQIDFSPSMLGTLNFSINDNSSISTAATYSNVLIDITSAQLNNTTSGTSTLSNQIYNWVLTDSNSDNAWDLNFTASCGIANYSNNHTISLDCSDGVTLTQAYSNTLTVDADVRGTTTMINATSFALSELDINTGASITNTSSAYAIKYDSLIYNSIENDGTISATEDTVNLDNGASLTTLSNTANGLISSSSNASAINLENSSTISTINNIGTINGDVSINNSTVTALENSGTINNGNYALYGISGSIGTFTNTGLIDGSSYDIYIDSSSTFTNLNNDQGANGNDPVTYYGKLPDNYNIIINSNSDYGQIDFTSPSGTTNFGIHSSSSLEATTYSEVISGISSSNLNSTTGTIEINGSSFDWLLNNSSGSVWDLVLSRTIGAADTQNSIKAIKGQFQGTINSISSGANFANMNTYDCNFFDIKGGCFSFGNRFTDVQSPSYQEDSFVATAGYKVNNNFRVAGFVDENLNYNTDSNLTIKNKSPLFGFIGVWNKNEDHTGVQVKFANAYQNKEADIMRIASGTSEAGQGTTDIETKSFVGEISYAILADPTLLIRPYIAGRYAVVTQDSYTEKSGASSPLSFNKIQDKSKTILLGMKFKKQITEKLYARGSVGVEHDLSHKINNLVVTGISGLTSESFSNKIDRTRPVASIGSDFMFDKNQKISATAFYQELAFTSTKSKTLYIHYDLSF